MRLWSLHPSLLDAKGLVACWRETLLAQKVLAGQSKGYTGHPQLLRFKAQPAPLVHMGGYLQGLWDEAAVRGYRFDAAKILHPAAAAQLEKIPVTQGQVHFEREHLLRKLSVRGPARIARLEPAGQVALHPLFVQVPGSVEAWEKDALASG